MDEKETLSVPVVHLNSPTEPSSLTCSGACWVRCDLSLSLGARKRTVKEVQLSV